MFKVVGDVTYINGQNGIYDGKIKNNSVRYARNSVDNYLKTYSVDAPWTKSVIPKTKGLASADNDTFERTVQQAKDYLDTDFPTAQFNLKYAENKNGQADKMAVMAFAYEEMGKKTSISTDELTATLRSALSEENKPLVSADSLDINSDGKIDVAEYGTSILVEDMLSSDTSVLTPQNITGEINDKGQTALLSFAAINNYKDAHETYKAVYDYFNLDKAQEEFLSDKNNLLNNCG